MSTDRIPKPGEVWTNGAGAARIIVRVDDDQVNIRDEGGRLWTYSLGHVQNNWTPPVTLPDPELPTGPAISVERAFATRVLAELEDTTFGVQTMTVESLTERVGEFAALIGRAMSALELLLGEGS